MRFMIFRKADRDTEAGMMPSEALLTAMGAYVGEMVDAGVLLVGEGLQPSARGARVVFRNGKPTVTDGPFTEAKELIAGFSVIRVSSKQEALDWLLRWPTIDGDGNVELELRQIYEDEDLGIDFTHELREEEHRRRDETAARR